MRRWVNETRALKSLSNTAVAGALFGLEAGKRSLLRQSRKEVFENEANLQSSNRRVNALTCRGGSRVRCQV